jgi:TolB-like protein/DNA-binding winged helix-turn-helix (wHTH) protein/Tfp pilus assembly protein PilF
MPEAQHLFEFGPFRLDPSQRLLLRNGKAVSLTPKAFETLVILVENHGRLLSKDELMKRLWPATFVEEANLAQNVSAIRRALNGQTGGAEYIETVPKGGYRFCGSVRRVSSEPVVASDMPTKPQPEPARNAELDSVGITAPQPDGWGTRAAVISAIVVIAAAIVIFVLWRTRFSSASEAASRVTPIRSIAVLPLVNLSSDPAQEYFSDGLTDELITRVAQMGSLQVISRTSVMGYKHSLKKAPEIGNELHVDSIVEGTVERVNDRVRIRVQLIRTATDQHIWAETYDREIKDVLQLESDVAREIAQQIGQAHAKDQLQPSQKHVVPSEAHEDYLRGRYRWNQRSETALRAGIVHFQKAIDLDPLYPQAYAGLADSYIMLTNWGFLPAAEGYPKAESAARKALELDDQLSEAQASLAYATFLYDWDWSGAESKFRRAIELNPNYSTAHHFYSVYLMSAGRHAEAQREIERARELDPLSRITNSVVGWIYYEGRSYDKAMEQCQRTVDMDPTYGPSLLDLGSVYLAKREYDKAIAQFVRARAVAGNTATVLSYLAQGYAAAGKKSEARELLNKLEKSSQPQFVSPWEYALIHDALGDKDQALKFLQKAADQHAGWIVMMAVDPRLDDLHADPRFQQLAKRVHIPQTALAPGD